MRSIGFLHQVMRVPLFVAMVFAATAAHGAEDPVARADRASERHAPEGARPGGLLPIPRNRLRPEGFASGSWRREPFRATRARPSREVPIRARGPPRTAA